MKTWFTKNETEMCGCCTPKTVDQIYCHDCANFWGNSLQRDNLPFANENCKVDWMNEVLNHWCELVQK